jgi:hypothetical protein
MRAMAFPLSGTPSGSDTCRILLKGFPFSVFYRSDSDGILIFAIAHNSREPGYWQDSSSER